MTLIRRYTTLSKTVSFAAGVASRTVQVPTLADTSVEGNESINLTLTDSSGGSTLRKRPSAWSFRIVPPRDPPRPGESERSD